MTLFHKKTVPQFGKLGVAGTNESVRRRAAEESPLLLSHYQKIRESDQL